MESAQLTGWGNTSAVFYPGGEYEQTIPGVGMLTPEVREVDIERTHRFILVVVCSPGELCRPCQAEEEEKEEELALLRAWAASVG